ncbi:MAG TPA: UDP-N-acetylglucosamine 1-carboxyvinyltransferase [Candidatus Nanoarchaeia archaeon]|nr:UDP-N-acetylglucosamine 1-carboxyvinyltransferase [Candidatus Nanoarchaeia archaeon]
MGVEAINIQIEGGHTLNGTVVTKTSKNGAMGLLAASLLNKGKTLLKNVPKIEEVFRMIEVFQSIGVEVNWHGNDLEIIPPKEFAMDKLNTVAAERTRSVIMLIGPLIHYLKKFSLPQAGGCKLGSRTVKPHLYALEKMGVDIKATENSYEVTVGKLTANEIVLYEAGDTVTENAIIAAAGIPGTTVIKYASANYMGQEVCFYLERLGVKIEGIGTTTLTVHGREEINTDVTYEVSEDPIESMFFIAAAILTGSSITIERCPIDFLEVELFKLEKMGFKYDVLKKYVALNGRTNLVDIQTHPSKLIALEEKIESKPYPGLNIDNLPFFAVIATQATGTTFIHDWVYEKRAIHFKELDKLGADTILADPHRFYITGPTKLKAAEVIAPPALRPAAIILIGMLGASGTSVLRNIYSINRGYEDIIKRLNDLGAKIKIL